MKYLKNYYYFYWTKFQKFNLTNDCMEQFSKNVEKSLKMFLNLSNFVQT